MFLKGCCFVRAITGSEYCLFEERIRPPELGSLSRAQLSKGNAIDSKHQEDFYNPFILTQIESHARKDFLLDDTIIICMFKTCFFITIQHLHCFKVRPPSPAENKVKTLDRSRWPPMYMQWRARQLRSARILEVHVLVAAQKPKGDGERRNS